MRIMIEEIVKKESALIELVEVLSEIDDYEELTRVIAERLTHLFEAERLSILMLNPDQQEMVKTIIREEKKIGDSKFNLIQRSITGWVLKNQKDFFSLNLYDDERLKQEQNDKNLRVSVICVPLYAKREIIGTLIVCKVNEELTDEDLRLLKKSALIISPFLNNANMIKKYFQPSLSEEELIIKFEKLGLIGKSEEFLTMARSIESAAKCDVRVLLMGETGTGKELIAKAIHKLSSRSDKQFTVIDCAAIPANLIDSELFGYVKGSFTGAFKDRIGLIEEANFGTVFIDEINLLPLDLQSKLLRLVQEGEYRPLGSNEYRKVDIRIIVASSANLFMQVRENKFREELYYRLNVYPIHVPTLDERKGDIVILANYFIKKYAAKMNKMAVTFDQHFFENLIEKKWKGNIRELENFTERLIALYEPTLKMIQWETLPESIKIEFVKTKSEEQNYQESYPLNEKLALFEEQNIRKALIESDWNQSKAARFLQIPEQTLRYKMNKYKISNPSN